MLTPKLHTILIWGINWLLSETIYMNHCHGNSMILQSLLYTLLWLLQLILVREPWWVWNFDSWWRFDWFWICFPISCWMQQTKFLMWTAAIVVLHWCTHMERHLSNVQCAITLLMLGYNLSINFFFPFVQFPSPFLTSIVLFKMPNMRTPAPEAPRPNETAPIRPSTSVVYSALQLS